MSKISTPQEPSRLPSQTLQALQAVQSNVGQAYKGASVEAPQSEQFTQLAAMADSSLSLVTQRKLTDMQSNAAAAPSAPPAANHTGLPTQLKAGIESLSGMSMDHVQVHYNSSKPAQLQALAYAQGSNIHVGPGQEKHLPHEAWHVVQQAQGRVRPTVQAKGMPINDDPGLEREADVMGARAMFENASTKPSKLLKESSIGHIQRKHNNLRMAPEKLIENKMFSKFNKIQEKILKYNEILISNINYNEQIKKLDEIRALADAWLESNTKPSFAEDIKFKKHDELLKLKIEVQAEINFIQKNQNPTWTTKTGTKDLPDHLKTDFDTKKSVKTAGIINIENINPVLIEQLGSTPNEMHDRLTKRVPNGPLLTQSEADFIKTLPEIYLSATGMFSHKMAVEYIKNSKYQTWLLLSAPNRLWLSYIAWREFRGEEFVKGTPPYSLGRSMDGKDTDNFSEQERHEIQQEIDQSIKDAWFNTFYENGHIKHDAASAIVQGGVKREGKVLDHAAVVKNIIYSKQILKKILIILHAGLEIYNKDSNQFEAHTGSVVRALSHGGRVNIRIPSLASEQSNPHALMQWIGLFNGSDNGSRLPLSKTLSNKDNGLFHRDFGTHHLDIGDNDEDQLGRFREEGGVGAAVRSKLDDTVMLGINLAVGGFGNKDFNGDVILPDGAHGHMLIFYRPPTIEHDGGLMIGIETTGPHAASTVGYAHTAKSSEATANPESSFGGMKSDKIGDGSASTLGITTKPKSKSHRDRTDDQTLGRLVNLGTVNNGDWLSRLDGLEREFNAIGDQRERLEALIGRRRIDFQE